MYSDQLLNPSPHLFFVVLPIFVQTILRKNKKGFKVQMEREYEEEIEVKLYRPMVSNTIHRVKWGN